MDARTYDASPLKLSICITTLNRAAFIGATIESAVVQMSRECELVILDGGSTDGTRDVVLSYAKSCERLRYIRNTTNKGFDRDCDSAVQLSTGEYVWLMTDDDVLKPGAIASVLRALSAGVDVIVVNTELRNVDLSSVKQQRVLRLTSDLRYVSHETDRFVSDAANILPYVGCFIVRRAVWLRRDRERYFGSLFSYLWVIFQGGLPGDALIIAEPLITYRMGNSHSFSPKMFEAFMITLPALVWSLELSEFAKSRVCASEPWRSFLELLRWRALGWYSSTEYEHWVRPRAHSMRERLGPSLAAWLPGVLVNAGFLFYYSVSRSDYRQAWSPAMMVQAMKDSRFYFGRLLGRSPER